MGILVWFSDGLSNTSVSGTMGYGSNVQHGGGFLLRYTWINHGFWDIINRLLEGILVSRSSFPVFGSGFHQKKIPFIQCTIRNKRDATYIDMNFTSAHGDDVPISKARLKGKKNIIWQYHGHIGHTYHINSNDTNIGVQALACFSHFGWSWAMVGPRNGVGLRIWQTYFGATNMRDKLIWIYKTNEYQVDSMYWFRQRGQ